MKLLKVKTIIFGTVAALFSYVLLVVGRRSSFRTTGEIVAYFVIPAVLVLMIIFVYQQQKLLWQLSVGFLVYWLLMTGVDVLIYKPWEVFTTPAGDTYTRYGLDAMYPQFGFNICMAAIIVALLVAYIFAFAKRVSDKYYASHIKTDERIKE